MYWFEIRRSHLGPVSSVLTVALSMHNGIILCFENSPRQKEQRHLLRPSIVHCIPSRPPHLLHTAASPLGAAFWTKILVNLRVNLYTYWLHKIFKSSDFVGLKYILKYLTTTAHKLNEVLVMVRKRVNTNFRFYYVHWSICDDHLKNIFREQ